MLHRLGLDGYSLDSLLLFSAIVLFASLFFGIMADYFSGDKGFGVFGNGILVALGCLIGYFARSEYISYLAAIDSAVVIVFYASVVTLLLLGACFAKRILYRVG